MRRAAAAGLVWAACASAPPSEAPAPPPEAEATVLLSVDLLAGAPAGSLRAAPGPARVALVVDVSAARVAGEADAAVAARLGARRFLDALPPGTDVSLHAIGHPRGAGCTAPAALGRAADAAGRDALSRQLDGLVPRTQGSLAEALEALWLDLEAESVAPRTRVVVWSGLDARCGGDVCAALEKLVAAGVAVDFVAPGGAYPPACVAATAPPVAPPAFLGSPPARVPYRVESADGRTVGRGVTGGAPARVAPGPATVVLELGPEERLGPVEIPVVERATLRALVFPNAVPPVREIELVR
jgi:hypothetical protein